MRHQSTAAVIDPVSGQSPGSLPGAEEKPSAGVDSEAARRLFGGKASNGADPPARTIDLECGDAVVAAVGRVKKASGGHHLDVAAGVAAREFARQCSERLESDYSVSQNDDEK